MTQRERRMLAIRTGDAVGVACVTIDLVLARKRGWSTTQIDRLWRQLQQVVQQNDAVARRRAQRCGGSR